MKKDFKYKTYTLKDVDLSDKYDKELAKDFVVMIWDIESGFCGLDKKLGHKAVWTKNEARKVVKWLDDQHWPNYF